MAQRRSFCVQACSQLVETCPRHPCLPSSAVVKGPSSAVVRGKGHIRNDPCQGRGGVAGGWCRSASSTGVKSHKLFHAVTVFPTQTSHLLELRNIETSKHLCPVCSIPVFARFKVQAIKAIRSSYRRECPHIPAV